MSSIDLRAAAPRDGRQLRPPRFTVLLVLLVLAGLALAHQRGERELTAALAAQRRVAANHTRMLELAGELAELEKRRAAAGAALATVQAQAALAAQLACTLRQVAAALPETAWLDVIEWRRPSLRLVGGAADPSAVQQLRDALGIEMRAIRIDATSPGEDSDSAIEFALTLEDVPILPAVPAI